MRIVTAALIALAVSPAAADTAVRISGACEVRFVRAPDEVRHVIERWLAAEPVCVSSIDLRVVPTDDGYYLLAQRGDGRIHERMVPDADSAGVLVASWVADDWVEAPPRPAPVAPRPLIVNPFADQPEGGVATRAAARSSSGSNWFTLSAMIRPGGGGGGGIRAELDLFVRGSWSLGTALSASRSYDTTTFADGINTATYGTEDLKAIAYIARTSTFGRWELRLAAGAGVLQTESGLTEFPYMPGTTINASFYGTSGATPVAETSALLTRRLGTSWAVSAGPVLTLMDQDLLTVDPGLWDPIRTVATRESELMFVAGLRYSL